MLGEMMNIAVNDLSFIKGFQSFEDAVKAVNKFCELLRFLRDEKVSGVEVPMEIRNSNNVHPDMTITPDGYTLRDVLFDIKTKDNNKYLFLITIFTKYTQIKNAYGEEDVFVFDEMESKHCARYRNDFLLSLDSGEKFLSPVLNGTINRENPIGIKNIADELHIYQYWEPLGYRRYELNPKHKKMRNYVRNKGMSVGMAPKTDELGQQMLNKAIAYQGKLYSVDVEDDNAIYEFPKTQQNIFHAFKREDLQPDMIDRIIRMWQEKNKE